MCVDREQFEKLLSAWLDEPNDAALRELDAAAAQSVEFANLRAKALRVEALLKAPLIEMERIDWNSLRQRVGDAARAAKSDSSAEQTELDDRVRAMTDIDGRVDWTQLRQRISSAVREAEPAERVIRFPRWRAAALALVGVAAACAMLMMLPQVSTRLPVEPVIAKSAAVARVQICSAGDEAHSKNVATDEPAYASVARVRISAAPKEPVAEPSRNDSPADENVFVMMTLTRPEPTMTPTISLN